MCAYRRLRLAEVKPKKTLKPQSSKQKGKQKYYDMIMKKLQEFADTSS